MGDPFRARPKRDEAPAASGGDRDDGGTAVVTVETSQTTETVTVDEPTLEPVDRLPAHSKLKAMRKAELQALCRARGVSFGQDDEKDDLVDALEKAAGR